jgi:hypothetical protein
VVPVKTLERLRRILANKFRVQLELIETHEDVERIAGEHSDFSPHLRRRLIEEFIDGETEGITLQRESFDPLRPRFLVVVDGRGERSNRAYFTTWHEISHLLIHPEQLPIPGFRRTPLAHELARDPIEQVVDHVAGRVAFYEPLFRPVAEGAITAHGGLTFGAVESAKAGADIPTASLYATAIQMVPYSAAPTALVTVDLILKPSEVQRLRSPQEDFGLAPAAESVPQLRITAFIANTAVEGSRLELWRNMRVPEACVLSQAFNSAADDVLVADEDQSSWSTSVKGSLPRLPLRIEAMRRGRFVYGLIAAL